MSTIDRAAIIEQAASAYVDGAAKVLDVIEGTVTTWDDVDERTRTITVRIAVPNADRALKPGMFGTARIASAVASPVDGLVERMSAIRVGPGPDEASQCGPLINRAAVDKVDTLVRDAVARGARVLVGGSDGAAWCAPALPRRCSPEAAARTCCRPARRR